MERGLIDQVGGFRPECDGAQDWDLLLRLAELRPRVRHVPRVLYHWRAVPGSAAASASAKPWAVAAQERALGDWLGRRQLEGEALGRGQGGYRLCWRLPREPLVSVVIPTRDHLELTAPLVQRLREQTDYAPLEIILVDNDSRDQRTLAQYERWRQQGAVRTVDWPGAFNYSGACNAGARAARGELLLFLNNDVEPLDRQWLRELVRWALFDEIGVVGSKLLYPDGRIQHAGVGLFGAPVARHLFRWLGEGATTLAGTAESYRNCAAVTGACQLVRRDVFEQLGGYDERYTLCYSDLALCLAAWRHNYRVVYTPDARLRHHECATRGFGDPRELSDAELFARQLADWQWTRDPFLSPHIDWSTTWPRLADPRWPGAPRQWAQRAERRLPAASGGPATPPSGAGAQATGPEESPLRLAS